MQHWDLMLLTLLMHASKIALIVAGDPNHCAVSSLSFSVWIILVTFVQKFPGKNALFLKNSISTRLKTRFRQWTSLLMTEEGTAFWCHIITLWSFLLEGSKDCSDLLPKKWNQNRNVDLVTQGQWRWSPASIEIPVVALAKHIVILELHFSVAWCFIERSLARAQGVCQNNMPSWHCLGHRP